MKSYSLLFLLTINQALAASPTPTPSLTPKPVFTEAVQNFSYAGYGAGEKQIPTPVILKSVKDYGAKGDGVSDDTAAFKNALAAALPGALLVPAGKYVIKDRLLMNRNGVVLRGEGPSSVLLFKESFKSLNAAGKISPPFEAYKYGQGGLLWVGSLSRLNARGAELGVVSANALRGSKSLILSDTSKVSTDSFIVVQMAPSNNSIRKYIASYPEVKVASDGGVFTWPVKVLSKSGNTIALQQALPLDVRPEWNAKIYKYSPFTEIGVENLRIEMPNLRAQGHHGEPGFNGLAFYGCHNCWAKNVEIFGADNSIDVNGYSKNVTLDHIKFLKRPMPNSAGIEGHHGVSFQFATDNMLSNFTIEGKWYHAITMDHFAAGNVVRKGSGVAVNLDHHMDSPFGNLFTDLNLGALANPYDSSGGMGVAHAGSWSVFWNVKANGAYLKCPHNYADTYWNHSYANDFPKTRVIPSSENRNDGWCRAVPPVTDDLYADQLQKRLGN